MKFSAADTKALNTKGIIHSIETCGTVDGPGIRYIIFTQGCPLRCQYCHNPDTWDVSGHSEAEMTVAQIMEDIIKYKPYMDFSGGGVTLSGGEPLLQSEFAAALFTQCEREGIHTALDTSGFAPLSRSAKVFNHTKLVLLDIKSINTRTFKKITEKDISYTLKTALYLSEKEIPLWIRFVLVPGLSDSTEEIDELAKFISSLKNVEHIEILPFHKMGEYKWEDLGYRYNLKETLEPSPEEIKAAKEIFARYGLSVQ